MFQFSEQIHLGLAFSLGFIVCILLFLVGYGLYRLVTPTPADVIEEEYNRQVALARERRSSIPPLNTDRMIKVFKALDDTQPVDRDDEKTGRFSRPPSKI
jgi:hypothetical protein